MKGNYISVWIISLICLFACSEEVSGPVSLEEFQAALGSRLEQESPPPNPSFLLTTLPESVGSFSLVEIDTSFFPQAEHPFAEAEKIFSQGEDLYLSVRIADYGTDSAALVQVFQRWEKHRATSVPLTEADSWEISSISATGALSHSYLLYSRYLLQLQTNHPEGAAQIASGLSQAKLTQLSQ